MLFPCKLLLTVLAVLVALAGPGRNVRAQDAKPRGFQMRTFTDGDNKSSKYVIYVPQKLDPAQKPPVLMFLHGSGEKGDNGIDQIMVGLGPALWKQRGTFPFIAIFPQCETGSNWLADGTQAQRAMEILQVVEKEFATDPDRVYLTGLSMGGAGTWSLALKYPDRFAAVVPMCGRGSVDEAQKLADAKLPIWNFCGDKDGAETVKNSRDMHEALTRLGADDRYTEYEGVGHSCWDNAYGTPELYTWLLEQSRSANAKRRVK